MVLETVALAFRRIALLNRGEPAVRFIRAVREYNLERGTDLRVIALYTDPDQGAPFVLQADEALRLGPPMSPGADGSMISSYCDHRRVLRALRAMGCDAVWPGWGFVSEDPLFVRLMEASGITFIGPSSRAMELLGDKIASKQLAEQCGVPMAPWYLIKPEDDEAQLKLQAEAIGYPLMIKASAGGGGRGIRKVRAPEQLLEALRQARHEVEKVFGQGGLFMESCITQARHIEVQLVAGADGKATALGVRDCSVQRRNQKVVEESPSPVLPGEIEHQLCTSAVRLAELAGYRGVGTAEFLFKPATGQVSFLEVNSRLQVEHTVTEVVFGVDLVKAMIDIALDRPWERPTWEQAQGHAIEVRLNAENPERGFQPSPGLVRRFRPASGPGVRVDSGVVDGMAIAPEFDSMIAKVIVWGPTRSQAIARMSRALRELEVVVEDGATNKAFLLDLLEHPAFVDASLDTAWLDTAVGAGEFDQPPWAFEALLVAAIVEYRRQRYAQVQRFFAQAQNGIPQNLPRPEGMRVNLRLRDRSTTIVVHALGRDHYLAGPEGCQHSVTLESTGDHAAVLHIGQRRHQALYAYGRTGIAVELDGAMHPVERASGGVVRANAPGMVVSVAVEEGDEVVPGDRLCTLEAMKMEMPVFAQEAGQVRSVLCHANQQVQAGQPLVVLQPTGTDEDEAQEAQDLPQPSPRPLDLLFDGDEPRPEAVAELDGEQVRAVMDDLVGVFRAVLLGYDLPVELVQRVERLFGANMPTAGLDRPERWAPVLTRVGQLQVLELENTADLSDDTAHDPISRVVNVVLGQLLATFADSEALFERNLLPLPGEAAAVSAKFAFYEFCRRYQDGADGAPAEIRTLLEKALARYQVRSLEPTDELREALWRLAVGHAHGGVRHRLCSALLRMVMDLGEVGLPLKADSNLRGVLERVSRVASADYPFVADNARQATYLLFERHRYVQRQQVVEWMLDDAIRDLDQLERDTPQASRIVDMLVAFPHALLALLARRAHPGRGDASALLEVILRRLYRGRTGRVQEALQVNGIPAVWCTFEGEGDGTLAASREVLASTSGRWAALEIGKASEAQVLGVLARPSTLGEALAAARRLVSEQERPCKVEVLVAGALLGGLSVDLDALVDDAMVSRRLTITWGTASGRLQHRTWARVGGRVVEDQLMRDIHPEQARRIELWRLQQFDLERIEGTELILAFRGRARSNPRDERIFVFAEVRELADGTGTELDQWGFERAYYEAVRVLRDAQSRQSARRRFHGNRMVFCIQPVLTLTAAEVSRVAQRLEPASRGLGVQKAIVQTRLKEGDTVRPTEFVVRMHGQHRLEVEERPPSPHPIRAMTPYDMRVVRAQRLGYTYPYEMVWMLQGRPGTVEGQGWPIPRGYFQEYDLDDTGQVLMPVERPYGSNTSGVVVGLMTHYTDAYPEGMARVWIASDSTKAMGALAEPECRRVVAALNMAEERELPVEWLPISAGARIAMDSGTENLDWTARVLRRIVEFTQGGGEINLIVAGVNVGAQSYWNAEATMLMHTRGVLIMTPEGSMVLTGKKALEYSGGVAAEDERGIGGFERIMGPNGQAQYFARDLGEAYRILFAHYRYTYRKSGEPGPRLHPTEDPRDRSVLMAPYRPVGDETFTTVGAIFDEESNPGRKKPFAIREVMAAVIDQDGTYLERFKNMRHAEMAQVWDASVGGHAVCMVGFESRPIPRVGRIPMEGHDTWTGGTLFPQSSRKVARALNGASGNRPVVVLANLSGFDGSPESLRKLQLEYGAEIGRAVVNFQGPIIFVVIGRYHGGSYVVFSKALNPNLTALALEGSFASVIGGAPAAAVVFPREVRRRAADDPRLQQARTELDTAPPARKPALREALTTLEAQIILEKQGEVAREFDGIHTVERAVEVGSLDAVIPPTQLRSAIIDALDNAEAVPIDWSVPEVPSGQLLPSITTRALKTSRHTPPPPHE